MGGKSSKPKATKSVTKPAAEQSKPFDSRGSFKVTTNEVNEDGTPKVKGIRVKTKEMKQMQSNAAIQPKAVDQDDTLKEAKSRRGSSMKRAKQFSTGDAEISNSQRLSKTIDLDDDALIAAKQVSKKDLSAAFDQKAKNPDAHTSVSNTTIAKKTIESEQEILAASNVNLEGVKKMAEQKSAETKQQEAQQKAALSKKKGDSKKAKAALEKSKQIAMSKDTSKLAPESQSTPTVKTVDIDKPLGLDSEVTNDIKSKFEEISKQQAAENAAVKEKIGDGDRHNKATSSSSLSRKSSLQLSDAEKKAAQEQAQQEMAYENKIKQQLGKAKQETEEKARAEEENEMNNQRSEQEQKQKREAQLDAKVESEAKWC